MKSVRLYAQMPDAKVRGYQPGRFSFNKPGGRCEACEKRLEPAGDDFPRMSGDCPVCEGRRFNRETLQVRYRGKSIHDVLEMEVAEALDHFEHVPKIHAMIQTLHDVGLDYIKLGQPSPTLSGGEAQRIKLAKELVRRGTGKTLYILDEPTTGLHFDDTRKLLEVLHGFVEQGNTVIVIEHSLDVIKTADWVIDLGPEGGSGGGRLVAVGTPETVAKSASSYTGQALAPLLFPRKRGGEKPKKARLDANGPKQEYITHLCVEGACQHNLKNVSARLRFRRMSVFAAEWIRQVVARGRHDLRGGAAACRSLSATRGSFSARFRNRKLSASRVCPRRSVSNKDDEQESAIDSGWSRKSTTTFAFSTRGSATGTARTAARGRNANG